MKRKKGRLLIVRKCFERAEINLDILSDEEYTAIYGEDTDLLNAIVQLDKAGGLEWEPDDFEVFIHEDDIISVERMGKTDKSLELLYEA